MARRIDQIAHLCDVVDRLPLHVQTCLLTNAEQWNDTGHHSWWAGCCSPHTKPHNVASPDTKRHEQGQTCNR